MTTALRPMFPAIRAPAKRPMLGKNGLRVSRVDWVFLALLAMLCVFVQLSL